VKKEIIRVI